MLLLLLNDLRLEHQHLTNSFAPDMYQTRYTVFIILIFIKNVAIV
jgi:hypothetical protein